MSTSLKQQTISGMLWSAVQKFGNMGISFVSNIILARMLTPDDYGCIGMLAIFITISSTFVDGGFASALIQKKVPTQKDYSTIFWWNLFISTLLYCVLYLSAPFIAKFYNIPLLSSILRVQGIILVINSLNIIQTNRLKKQLKFKRLANITIIAHTIAAISAILLAWKGYGVWSLVIQQIISSCIITTILWFINKWTPDLCFSKESFKQLFGFGSFILCSNLINTFCNNVQGLLIGRFFTPAAMGYYTQARKLEEIASNSFSSVVDQVSYPVLSKFQSDNVAMKNVLQKLVTALAFVTFPLMLILILIAEPLITIIYGEKWIACVPFFQILCIAGIAICLQGIHYYAVASKGESKDLFVWTIIKRAVGISFLIVGMYFWNIIGLLWGCSLGAWFILFSNCYLVSKHINYTLFQQIKDLFPICLLSAISYIIVYVFKYFYICNMYSEAFIVLFLYMMTYVILSYLFKIKSLYYFVEFLKLKKK